MAVFRSVLAACDLQKVVSKLGLHRAVNLTDLTAEHDLVKLGHHCSGTERAKVAAFGAGRTARVFAGDIGEILAALDRRQDDAKLYHSTDKASTAFELKYQGDRTPPNYFASMSRQKTDTKDVERFGVAVSMGEASVLSALLRHAVLVLSSWAVPVG